MNTNTEILRDDLAIGVHTIEAATSRVVNALQNLERQQGFDCDISSAALTALDTIAKFYAILEGVDDQLRQRAQRGEV